MSYGPPLSDEMKAELEAAAKKAREMFKGTFGPNPRCVICKDREGDVLIMPRPILPKDLDTGLGEKLFRDSQFHNRFPVGLWVCYQCLRVRKEEIEAMLPKESHAAPTPKGDVVT